MSYDKARLRQLQTKVNSFLVVNTCDIPENYLLPKSSVLLVLRFIREEAMYGEVDACGQREGVVCKEFMRTQGEGISSAKEESWMSPVRPNRIELLATRATKSEWTSWACVRGRKNPSRTSGRAWRGIQVGVAFFKACPNQHPHEHRNQVGLEIESELQSIRRRKLVSCVSFCLGRIHWFRFVSSIFRPSSIGEYTRVYFGLFCQIRVGLGLRPWDAYVWGIKGKGVAHMWGLPRILIKDNYALHVLGFELAAGCPLRIVQFPH